MTNKRAPKRVVQKIDSRKPITKESGDIPKRRTAAYARVSTDSEEQLNSYAAQVDYYAKYILSRPDWELVEVYTEMKIPKMIQFENMNPLRKRRNKGFWHIRYCQKPLFFCALEWLHKNENPKVNPL